MRRSEVIVNRLLEVEGQPGDEAEKCLPVPSEEAEVNHFKWPPIVPRSHTSFQYDQGQKTRPPDEHFEFDIPEPKVNPVKPTQPGLPLEAACNFVDNLLEVEEVDAAEMERYLALVKAKPQLKRYSREQLARYLATRPPAEPEPPSEPHQMRESIEKKLLAAAKGIKHCGDYGTLYYHPVKQQVHWTAGDADGPPDYTPPDEIQKLLKLPGIKHVEIGDEWSPKDEGWKRLTEDEEPEPDPRSEMDRLLPTTQSRLRGNSMIHAPGVINLAQMRWRERSKAAKKNGMDIIKAWQGLPEERYLRILNNDRITIETDGDDAIITFRDY